MTIDPLAEAHFHAVVAPEMAARIQADSPLIREMIAVQSRYNGDYIIPTPDVEGSANLPRTTPLLMAEAVDNAGRIAASVMFTDSVPIVNRAGWTHDQARANSATRRRILAATRDASAFGLLRRRGFRQLAGYATYGMDVVPDLKLGMPRIRLLNPLLAYPEPKAPEDMTLPSNLGHVTSMSASKLRRLYPSCRAEHGGPVGADALEDLWDLVEWTDPEWVLIGILGPREVASESLVGDLPSHLLSAYPNRIGGPNAIMPRRVTLGRIASQMTQLTGLVDLMDRINALSVEAGERGIYPDIYIIGDENQPPKLIGGEWKDGRTGEVNVVHNANQVGVLRNPPDPNSSMMVDRFERNFRIGTGLVPQTGGETYGALRTGRGIDALMSAAVDPRIQEMHEIDQHYQAQLGSIVLKTWKAWWGSAKVEVFSGWQSDGEMVEVTPNTDIPVTHVKSSYAIPGSGVEQTTVTLGQLLGTKGISLRSFRQKHPWIDDADAESKMIDEEAMEEFALSAIMSQIQAGALPLTYLAKIERFRKDSGDIFDAIEKADAEVRKEQQQAEELAAEQAQAQGPAPMELQAGLGPQQTPLVEEAPMVDPSVQGRVGQAQQLMSALQAGA